jgi:hypothetical protein
MYACPPTAAQKRTFNDFGLGPAADVTRPNKGGENWARNCSTTAISPLALRSGYSSATHLPDICFGSRNIISGFPW